MVGASRSVGRALQPLVAVAALATAVATARAQVTDAPGTLNGDGLPQWVASWSPLNYLADLPRELPGRAATFSELLLMPAPRIGVFWTAGNPAGLPFEVGDEHVQFGFGLLNASGDCRRPLDAGKVVRRRFSGLGWGELGERGGVIGRAVVEQTNLKDGAFADVLLPYGSNPFIVMDTTGHELGRTAARLEGAGGWRVGRLGLGLSLGYEAAETRTVASPVPRLNRGSATGVAGGVSHELLGDGRLRLAVAGRWRRAVERIQVTLVAAQTRLYQLEGYAEPVPLDPGSRYDRRLEREAWGFDLAVAGRALDGSFVGFARTEEMQEIQFNRMYESDPPHDRWDASGWTVGAAAQRPFAGERLLVTGWVRYSVLEGETHRWDIDDVTFRATEKSFKADLELRVLALQGWEAAGHLSLVRDYRTRLDILGRLRSVIHDWQPGAGIEVVRSLGPRFALSAGALLAGYAPSGGIPNPSFMGPVSLQYVAPELTLQVTGGRITKFRLGGRWQATAGLAFWAQGEYASLTPTEGAVTIPMEPTGDRTGWTLDFGALLVPGP
jgi:hypothetical protein